MNSKLFTKIPVLAGLENPTDASKSVSEADSRKIKRDLEHAKHRQSYQALRNRLELEYGTASHPKRDLLWSKAWDHGHAAGEYDVRYWYDEFAELLDL